MTTLDVIHPDDEKLEILLKQRFYWIVGIVIFAWLTMLMAFSAMFVYSKDIDLEIAKVNAPFVAKYIGADIKEREARSKAWGPQR